MKENKSSLFLFFLLVCMELSKIATPRIEKKILEDFLIKSLYDVKIGTDVLRMLWARAKLR